MLGPYSCKTDQNKRETTVSITFLTTSHSHLRGWGPHHTLRSAQTAHTVCGQGSHSPIKRPPWLFFLRLGSAGLCKKKIKYCEPFRGLVSQSVVRASKFEHLATLFFFYGGVLADGWNPVQTVEIQSKRLYPTFFCTGIGVTKSLITTYVNVSIASL